MTQCVLHTHTESSSSLQCFDLVRFAYFFSLLHLLSLWKMLFQRFSKLNTIFVAFFRPQIGIYSISLLLLFNYIYKTLYSSSKSNRWSRQAENAYTAHTLETDRNTRLSVFLRPLPFFVIMSCTIK